MEILLFAVLLLIVVAFLIIPRLGAVQEFLQDLDRR